MTNDEVVKRARYALGRKTKYRMGAGSLSPSASLPKDETGAADCSAFACWAVGIAKHDPRFAWLRALNGGWFNTDGIWHDAIEQSTGLFDYVELFTPTSSRANMRPGDLLVFPGRWSVAKAKSWAGSLEKGPAVGHVGIVVSVKVEDVRVVHCSSGNFRRTGDAVQLTGPTAFYQPQTIVARCARVEYA